MRGVSLHIIGGEVPRTKLTHDYQTPIQYTILQLLPLSEQPLYCDKNEFHNHCTVLIYPMTPAPSLAS